MREQFEKLPEINKILKDGDARFCVNRNSYVGYDGDFANGAYYAFQEQQKKIDSMLDHVCGSFEDFK